MRSMVGTPPPDLVTTLRFTLPHPLAPPSTATRIEPPFRHREVNGVTTSVDVEDHFQVIVRFASGAHGVITTGFTMQQATAPSVEIYGSAGTIQMLGHDWAPDGYELWTNDAGCWRRYPESEVGWPWTAGLDDANPYTLPTAFPTTRRSAVNDEHGFNVACL